MPDDVKRPLAPLFGDETTGPDAEESEAQFGMIDFGEILGQFEKSVGPMLEKISESQRAEHERCDALDEKRARRSLRVQRRIADALEGLFLVAYTTSYRSKIRGDEQQMAKVEAIAKKIGHRP